MTRKYFISACLAAVVLCVMAGCGNNDTKPTSQATDTISVKSPLVEQTVEPVTPVDDGVDWNTAICEIDKNGDTINKYEYNTDGKLIADYSYYDNKPVYMHTYEYDSKGNHITTNSYYEGTLIGGETREYDSQNRLIRLEYEEEADSGAAEFAYEGNRRIETSEDALSEVVYQDVTETYFDAQGNDTLRVRSSARVREHSDSDYNLNVEPVITKTRMTYVTINGVQRMKSSVTIEQGDEGLVIRQLENYEYDNLGRVVSYINYDHFSDDYARTDTIIYTYSGNCRTDQEGSKMYYKLKGK